MDVVAVVQWVVLLESDGRLLVEVFNSQHDLVSLITSYTRNGSVSLYGNVLHQYTFKTPLCSLGKTRPGHKVPGLNSECVQRRHCAAQGRTVD